MRHHYWEWPIASYLFLGGLGGGIFCLASIIIFFVAPSWGANYAMSAGIPVEVGQELTTYSASQVLAWPVFIALVCLALGCFFLVFELGQPLVFIRAFIKSTSIIAWGARLLTVCLLAGLAWWITFIPRDFLGLPLGFLGAMEGWRVALLIIAGICGTLIMIYTGVFLSTLKAHSFWATPALPVLFTVSALSTACAAISLSAGWWPADMYQATSGTTFLSAEDSMALFNLQVGEVIRELLHTVDLILIVIEFTVLLIMVLSFLGAGNRVANKVAHRWIHGSYAPLFWGGMIIVGLGIPFLIYASGGGNNPAAPILVLIGGLLLRFLIIYSDDRAPLPGEVSFYTKLPPRDAQILHAWKQGENLY